MSVRSLLSDFVGFLVTVVFLAAAILTLAVISARFAHAAALKPTIVVSVEPQAFIVERLLPALVNIEVMIPSGANHDTHEPTIEQLKAVSRAKMYVKIGHPSFTFETAWLDKFIGENKSLLIVDSSAGVNLKSGDPHIWLSPADFRIMARNVASALEQAFPDFNQIVNGNLAALDTEVDSAAAQIGGILASKRGHSFVVFHPAWGYFADEFGLKQIAIEREGKEADSRTLAEVLKEAREKNVRVVFVEPEFSRESADLVAGELGAKVQVLRPNARNWTSNLLDTAKIMAESL